MHYTFFMPVGGFGGLEIQMIKRAADNIANGGQSAVIASAGSKSEEFSLRNNIPFVASSLKRKYFDLNAIRTLGRLLRNENSDVCVCGHSYYLSIAILARNLYNPHTTVIFYQQLESGIKKKDPIHNWIYKRTDGAVTLTKIMKNELIRDTAMTESKVAVIPYGIDLSSFDPSNYNKTNLRDKFDIPRDSLVFGLIGRIEHTKGQDIAVQAFIRAAIPGSHLVLCGSIAFADYFDSLMKIAAEAGMTESITYIPFTDNIPELVNCFDISLMPSQKEAFGLVLVEAMAAGLPVIASDSGGVSELINHNVDGLLFRFPDIVELSDLMTKLAEDPELRNTLGRAAFKRANNNYIYKTQSDLFFSFCSSASNIDTIDHND